MVFRQCSVGGMLYAEDVQSTGTTPEKTSEEKTEEVKEISTSTDAAPSIQMSTEAAPSDASKKREGAFHSTPLSTDLQKHVVQPEDLFSNLHSGFFTVLALCHTVLVAQNPNVNEIQYKAQSPDEAALVQAAADVGFSFLGRERETMRLKTPFSETPQEYELLNVLEFTSARKRMSVVLRKVNDPSRKVYLLTKGADNIIYERLRKDESEDLKLTTQQHLDQFASEGMYV